MKVSFTIPATELAGLGIAIFMTFLSILVVQLYYSSEKLSDTDWILYFVVYLISAGILLDLL